MEPASRENVSPLQDEKHFPFSFKIFLLWTFVLIGRPQDYLPILNALRPGLTLTLLVVFLTVLRNKNNESNRSQGVKITKKYFFFFFVMVVGIPFAVHRGQAFSFVSGELLMNIIFYYFFLIHVDSVKKLKSVMYILCISLLLYSLMVLISGSSSGGRISYGGMFDSNDLAYYSVTLLPICLVLLDKNEKIIIKISSLVAIGCSLLVILLSGSRGGVVSLLVVAVLIFFTKLSGLSKAQKKLALICGVVLFSASLGSINMERITSMGDLSDDYNVTSEDGRLGIWRSGIELSLLHPITGVGVSCFPNAIGYLWESKGLPPKWRAPHNSYVQILAETGFIGLVLFCMIIYDSIHSLRNCIKAAQLNQHLQEVGKISGIILIAFTGSLVGAFFLSQGYALFFPLFFAISAKISDLSTGLLAASTDHSIQE